jgi:hypothetical protein
MIVYRPYSQTNFFNLFIGILAPAGFGWWFYYLINSDPFPGKMYMVLSFPILVAGGIYYLFTRSIWKMVCDDEKGFLYFYKTFRKVHIRVQELKELSVFKTFRGYDFRFSTRARQVTVEEMDGMPELVAYLKRINPKIDVNSPEDHKVF